MGAESAILASLVTAGSGLLGVVLAKCKCLYKRDSDGNCAPIVAFSDKASTPDEHEIGTAGNQTLVLRDNASAAKSATHSPPDLVIILTSTATAMVAAGWLTWSQGMSLPVIASRVRAKASLAVTLNYVNLLFLEMHRSTSAGEAIEDVTSRLLPLPITALAALT